MDARELQGRPTGVGRYLRCLLRAWPTGSGDRLIAYFNGPAPDDPGLREARVEARALGERPVRGLVFQERRLPAAARDDRLDVFFAPAYTCPLTLRAPRVTTIHDFSFFSVPEDFTPTDGFRRRALARASLRSSRRVIAVSDFTRREIVARFPETADRVATVTHGSDGLPKAPPRDAARARLGVRGPLLLSVGSILNRRCLPVLLHATAGLLRSHPGLVLDVVGENRTHPLLDLAAIVRGLGLDRSVRLSGFVDEAALADRYAAADAVVYLSEYEGFGLPVLEALARGIPVLTSTRPATGELFAGAALLADPRDAPGITSALERLMDDAPLRADLVDRGRALAARYSWKEAAARVRETLAAAAGE